MRRYTVIFFTLFYALIATESSVAIHSCMGYVKSISLLAPEKTCCCGDVNDADCCDDEMIDFPNELSDQVSNSYEFEFEQKFQALDQEPVDRINLLVEENQLLFFATDLPPPSAAPLYLLNCSFTFYG